MVLPHVKKLDIQNHKQDFFFFFKLKLIENTYPGTDGDGMLFSKAVFVVVRFSFLSPAVIYFTSSKWAGILCCCLLGSISGWIQRVRWVRKANFGRRRTGRLYYVICINSSWINHALITAFLVYILNFETLGFLLKRTCFYSNACFFFFPEQTSKIVCSIEPPT